MIRVPATRRPRTPVSFHLVGASPARGVRAREPRGGEHSYRRYRPLGGDSERPPPYAAAKRHGLSGSRAERTEGRPMADNPVRVPFSDSDQRSFASISGRRSFHRRSDLRSPWAVRDVGSYSTTNAGLTCSTKRSLSSSATTPTSPSSSMAQRSEWEVASSPRHRHG